MLRKSLLVIFIIINLKNCDCASRLNGNGFNSTTMKKARALMIAGGSIVTTPTTYVVYLNLPDDRCVGTLLNPTTILTAAHCVYRLRVSRIILKAGVDDISQTGLTVPVRKIYPHPNYNPNLQRNDIAILKLAAPLSGLSYMSLPTRLETVSGKCYAYGWGPAFPQLRTVELNHLDQAACSNIEMVRQRIQAGILNLDNKVCGRANDNWGGSEPGDSGGPLVCNNKVFGVASQLAVESDPELRVSFYIDVRKYLDLFRPLL